MYLTMAFVGCIIFPYAVISKGITLKNPPFRVVVVGTIYGVCGALLAIGMGSICGMDMSGAEQVEQMVNAVTSNDSSVERLGLSGVSKEEQASQLTAYYSSMFELMPTLFFILGAIVSYLEYRLIASIKRKKGKDVIPMPPINEFGLDKNALFGWLTLLVFAFLLLEGDTQYGHMIYVNVFALMGYAYALQGIALLFHFSKLKRVNKVFPIILTIALLFAGKGMYVLFAAGLMDAILGLKGRIRGR